MQQIHVNGKDYDLVALDDLTLDEAMVVWDYARLSLASIPDLEDFHPGVIAALIHVSVARGEPEWSRTRIRSLVGALPVAELEGIFADLSEEVESALPPPGGSSSSRSSGSASSSTGEPHPASDRANGSGDPPSVTGAASDLATSEV